MKTPKQLTPLIDADILCYRCGFATKEGEPVENSLHGVKKAVNDILDEFPGRESQALYLTGKGNFRDEYCKLLPEVRPKHSKTGEPWKYKGNRDSKHKPIYYKEIRQYLQEYWLAQMITGYEADDELGIQQWQNKDKSTVIVSNDKDMKMIPGWHYNWVKQELTYIPLNKADTWLFWQMVVGDTSDNIPGIKGNGPKYADEMLYNCGSDPAKIKAHVEELYKKEYGDMWEVAFDEVATLLWIKRNPDKTWRDYYG